VGYIAKISEELPLLSVSPIPHGTFTQKQEAISSMTHCKSLKLVKSNSAVSSSYQ
jgi:hypothetical protein